MTGSSDHCTGQSPGSTGAGFSGDRSEETGLPKLASTPTSTPSVGVPSCGASSPLGLSANLTATPRAARRRPRRTSRARRAPARARLPRAVLAAGRRARARSRLDRRLAPARDGRARSAPGGARRSPPQVVEVARASIGLVHQPVARASSRICSRSSRLVALQARLVQADDRVRRSSSSKIAPRARAASRSLRLTPVPARLSPGLDQVDAFERVAPGFAPRLLRRLEQGFHAANLAPAPTANPGRPVEPSGRNRSRNRMVEPVREKRPVLAGLGGRLAGRVTNPRANPKTHGRARPSRARALWPVRA